MPASSDAIGFGNCGARRRVLTLLYLLLTITGVVALGWHSAVDGYTTTRYLPWWLAASVHR